MKDTHFHHISRHAKLIAQTEREMRQAIYHPANQGMSEQVIAEVGVERYAEHAFVSSRKGFERLGLEFGTAAAHVAFEYLGFERG